MSRALFFVPIFLAVISTGIPPAGAQQNRDPDVRVPLYSSVREACMRFAEQSRVHDAIKERTDPFILKYANQAAAGIINNSQYQRFVASASAENKDADQRYKAAQIAVLRAAGYHDWEMYSRYSVDGIGDLWDKNIIAGERVADNKSHPHYRYTHGSLWSFDVSRICRNYR